MLGDQALCIDESYTLGSIMDQIKDEAWRSAPSFDALDNVYAKLKQYHVEHPTNIILVERFHLTTYALFPYWEYVEKFDTYLADLSAALVLLTIPDGQAEERSIDRQDDPDYAETMIGYFGSREAAVRGVTASQSRRVDALTKTQLPFLCIDTQKKDWDSYADTIINYIRN
jgi:hypothetical protein